MVDGWLHAIDVAPDEIRVRDAGGQDWVCSYDPALEATMRGLLDTQVRVMGTGRRNVRRATFEVVKVEALAPAAGVLADRGRSAEKVLDEALAAAHIYGHHGGQDQAPSSEGRSRCAVEPYSVARPLPPWVCTAWSTARTPTSPTPGSRLGPGLSGSGRDPPPPTSRFLASRGWQAGTSVRSPAGPLTLPPPRLGPVVPLAPGLWAA